MPETKTCNGWKNYETWNVALWIGNEKAIYDVARYCRDYAHFQNLAMGEGCRPAIFEGETPDGVNWDSNELDIKALDELIERL